MFLIAVIASAGISAAPTISRPVAPAPVSRPVATQTHPTTHVRPPQPNLNFLPGHEPVQNAYDCYRLAMTRATTSQEPILCPRLIIMP